MRTGPGDIDIKFTMLCSQVVSNCEDDVIDSLMWTVGTQIKIRLSPSASGDFLVKNVIFLTNEDMAEPSSPLRRLQGPGTGWMMLVTTLLTILGLLVGLGLGTWRRSKCLPSIVTMRRTGLDSQPIVESPIMAESETPGMVSSSFQETLYLISELNFSGLIGVTGLSSLPGLHLYSDAEVQAAETFSGARNLTSLSGGGQSQGRSRDDRY